MIKIRRQQCEKKEERNRASNIPRRYLAYLIYLKKKQLLERPNTDEIERGENSNERSRRKFVRFLEWNPLSRLCIWGSVDKALPSLRQLMTQSGSGWLSLYKGLGYTRGRTSQCAECTCLAAFINTVARTQLRTSERERIPRRVLLLARSFSKFVRQSPSPLDIYLQLSRFLVKAGLNVNFWNRASLSGEMKIAFYVFRRHRNMAKNIFFTNCHCSFIHYFVIYYWYINLPNLEQF